MKAWLVTDKKWPELKLIYTGLSSGEARSACMLDQVDAGYNASYFDAKAVRAPEHDTDDDVRRCLGWRDKTISWGVLLRDE